MSMPKAKVPWNVRLGTVGESEVKAKLAYFSIPTKYETDPGIDFYCELIEDDSPSIPFYVQAKGTEHFDDVWGQSVTKSTVTYWLQQEFPVFLIVYDENDGNCYWMSIEDSRYSFIEGIFTTDSNTIYVKMDRSNALQKGKDKNELFIKKLKQDLASVKLFRGNPQFIGDEYVKRIPPQPRSDVELLRIKENVRANIYSLLQHYMLVEDLETAWIYCSFLVEFDKKHYNHFVWHSQLAKELGKVQVAKASLKEALRICRADKDWPRESMNKIIAAIEGEIKALEICT